MCCYYYFCFCFFLSPLSLCHLWMSSITLFHADKYTFICIHLGSIVFWFGAHTHSSLCQWRIAQSSCIELAILNSVEYLLMGLLLAFSHSLLLFEMCVAMVVSFTYCARQNRKMQNCQFHSNVSPSRVPLPFVLKCNTNIIKSNLLRIVRRGTYIIFPPSIASKNKQKRSEKKIK